MKSDNDDTYKILDIFDNSFPDKIPTDVEQLLVVCDYQLYENGDIKRKIKIRLRALTNGVNNYIWRIPHLYHDNKPYGIRIYQDSEIIPFQAEIIEKNNSKSTQVTISIHKLNKGEEAYLTIEFFQKDHIKLIKKKLFYSEWEYYWAYKFYRKTYYFEMRIILPKSAKIDIANVKSTLSSNEALIKIENNYVYFSEIWNPPSCCKIGRVPYRIPSPAMSATISLISGLILAVPLGLIIELQWYWTIIFTIFVAFGIFFAHRVSEKNL